MSIAGQILASAAALYLIWHFRQEAVAEAYRTNMLTARRALAPRLRRIDALTIAAGLALLGGVWS